MSEIEVFGGEGMKMVQLPLDAVVVRVGSSARAEPTEDEVEQLASHFAEHPMLHVPVVAKREEQWVLVAGYLRFLAWNRLEHPVGVFRWIEGTDTELMLLSLAENVVRARLRPHELVERIALLHARGVTVEEIGSYSGYSIRYLRQLLAMKRDAHPELWRRFAEQAPHLGVTAMLDLVAHPVEEQLERWLEAEKHWRRGDTSARGFAEEEEEDGHLSGGAAARRRFPRRREVKQLLSAVMAEESIAEDYRQGVVDALRWMLFDAEMGTRFSWKTLRKMGPSVGKVIPIRPDVSNPNSSTPDAPAEGSDAEQASDADQAQGGEP